MEDALEEVEDLLKHLLKPQTEHFKSTINLRPIFGLIELSSAINLLNFQDIPLKAIAAFMTGSIISIRTGQVGSPPTLSGFNTRDAIYGGWTKLTTYQPTFKTPTMRTALPHPVFRMVDCRLSQTS